jgi:CubicO group peptidase (beta-lactamase class C family)
VEAASHESLDDFVARRIFDPLGMTDTGFHLDAEQIARLAPTPAPLGRVHDSNAAALGGAAGHAGLFSTASDLAIFAQMILNGGIYDGVRIVSDSTVKLFTTRASGSRALGWAMADGQWGSGRFLAEGSFGHVGYTGTSLWIDPEREMFVILLTNRVHAARARRPAKVIADVRADLADAASIAVTDDPDTQIAMPASFRSDLAKGWNRSERHHVRRSRHASSRSSHAAASKSKAKSASAKRTKAATKHAVAKSKKKHG